MRYEISAHNVGDLLLKQELEVLREKSELTPATEDLAVKKC